MCVLFQAFFVLLCDLHKEKFTGKNKCILKQCFLATQQTVIFFFSCFSNDLKRKDKIKISRKEDKKKFVKVFLGTVHVKPVQTALMRKMFLNMCLHKVNIIGLNLFFL